jgi:hypothetical protein
MEKFRITVASLPDREDLVAEVFYDGVQWVEISWEKEDELTVQFYSHPRLDHWEFPLDQALTVLEKAKSKLLGMGKKRNV